MSLKTNCRAIKRFSIGNSLVELLVGPQLTNPIFFSDNVAAFPVGELGNTHHIAFGGRFLKALTINTDQTFFQLAIEQGQKFNSVAAIVYRNLTSAELQSAADGRLPIQERAKALLSFYLAAPTLAIARLQWPSEGLTAVEFLGPRYRGVPRTDADPISPELIGLCANDREDDDKLHYWIATLEQAHAIDEEYFRIARLFSLLEAIAAPIISDLTRQYPDTPITRTAIRLMLGYFVEFDVPRFTIQPSAIFEFDHIELAGRIRQKIFHGGGHLTRAEVPASLHSGIDLLERRPDMISHVLRRDAELEIARWASRDGIPWKVAAGEKVVLPARDPSYSGKELAKLLVTSFAQPRSAIVSVFVRVVGGDIGAVRLGLNLGGDQLGE